MILTQTNVKKTQKTKTKRILGCAVKKEKILRLNHELLGADVVGEQPEVSVGRDEGEDPLGFPALEPNARVEADVVQQPGILGKDDGKRESFTFHFYE